MILLFFAGLTYLDPPPESGIAINFGTSDVGSGNIQPQAAVESAPRNTTPEPPQVEKAPEVKEEVVTQETEEAPVIKEEPKKEEKKA